MRLNHVRDFVAVIDTGSMSAAARALGISQPNITKSIRALESQLRVQLLQRTTRGVVPTRYGRLLYSRARVAQSELQRAEQELGELAGHQAGFVAFGLGPVVADLVMPEAMAAFRKQFPLAGVRIFEGFAHALVPMVRDETLDFAVGPRLPEFQSDSSIRFQPLFLHQRVVVGRKAHPLSRAKSLRDLAQAGWLSFEPQALLQRDFASCGLPPPAPVIQCESYVGFLRLLETTDMLGTVPRSILSRAAANNLYIFEIAETLPTLTVGLFTRADSPLTPAAAALARAMTAAGRGLARQLRRVGTPVPN